MSEVRVWTGGEADEERSCLIKTRYETRRKATNAVTAMRRRGIDVHAYTCAYCRGFHVGRPRDRGRSRL